MTTKPVRPDGAEPTAGGRHPGRAKVTKDPRPAKAKMPAPPAASRPSNAPVRPSARPEQELTADVLVSYRCVSIWRPRCNLCAALPTS